MPVPNTFANATTSIPLSQLDANFATAITLGNTAIQLGNTVTTLNNMTLANVTVSSGNVTATKVTTPTVDGGGSTALSLQANGSTGIYISTSQNIGMGNTSPGVKLVIGSTDAVKVPTGTTGERPTGATGYLRFNTTLNSFEGYNGSAWGSIGGGAAGGGTDKVFYLNDQTVTTDYSIPSGQNAGTFGPLTVNSGVTVTVPSGSTWTVV